MHSSETPDVLIQFWDLVCRQDMEDSPAALATAAEQSTLSLPDAGDSAGATMLELLLLGTDNDISTKLEAKALGCPGDRYSPCYEKMFKYFLEFLHGPVLQASLIVVSRQ